MKNIIHTSVKSILLFSIFFSLFSTFGQAPQKMSYQAVIRNSSGALIASTSIRIKVSILENAATGFAVYSEDHLVATNANGLATFNIGAGTVLSGSFSAIDWANGNYFVKTETDPTAGTSYTIVGTSQLTSVPYALSSLDNKWASNANGINYNLANVGIGTATPASKLDIAGTNSWDLTTTQGDFRIGSQTANFKLGVATDGGGAGHTTMTSTAALSLGTGTINPNVRTLNITGGNVGIGTQSPTEKLEVTGKTKTSDLQVTTGAAAGKVLTSDASGNATWQVNPSINSITMKVCINIDGVFPSDGFPNGNVTFLGEIRVFPYFMVPFGWLVCNGQLLSTTSYPGLFTLIGTLYGGNGSTNFALPNLTGKVIIGQ